MSVSVPPSIPGLIGIIALGAVSLSGCVVVVLKKKSGPARFVAAVLALVVGGAITYAVSVLPEDFGWMTALTILGSWPSRSSSTSLSLEKSFWKRVQVGVDYLGRGGDGRDAEKRAVIQRAAIRVLTPLILIAALVGAILVAANIENAPSIAFGDPVVFAGLLVLLFFYGALLILIPLVRGIVAGEWPIELTTSGARYSDEKLGEAGEKVRQRLKRFETKSVTLDTRLESEIKDLKNQAGVDLRSQEEVNDRAVERIAELEAQVRDLRSGAGAS